MPTLSEKDGLATPSTIESDNEVVKKTCANPKKGGLVWLLDDSVKRFEHKLGQINKIFTANDNFLRSVTVKMSHGKLNLPVVKLAQYSTKGFPRTKQGHRR